MKVAPRVYRLWVGLLLAVAGIFAICGCSDNDVATNGAPVVMNADLPAATTPTEEDRLSAVTPAFQESEHDVAFTGVSLGLSNNAGFITSPNQPTPSFMLTANDENGNPIFSNVSVDVANNAGVVTFSDLAILPPGNIQLSLGPNTLLALDGYTSLQGSRDSVSVPLPDMSSYPGLIISKMNVLFSVNNTGATPSWTLPAKYGQLFMRTSDGKYTMKDSTFTLSWDNVTSKAPADGKVTITMDLFDGNAATPKFHGVKTETVSNGQVAFGSMSNVTFSRVEFTVDMSNQKAL